MLISILCDYSNAYILVRGTITVTGEEADDNSKRGDVKEKGVICKNCPPFIDCTSEIK